MPKFSVIVPIYNVEAYIGECIESILAQTFEDFEVLCVDDCGKDNSMKIVEELAQKDSRVKIIRHEKNKGLGAARNTALKQATGEYIVCVDSDDKLVETCLEKVLTKFEETKLESVWFKCNIYWEEQDSYTSMVLFPQLDNFKEGYLTLNTENFSTYPLYAWNKAYRRDFIIENNIEWADGLIFEDVYFHYLFFTRAPKTYVIDYPLYIYRRRGSSIIGECIAGKQKIEDIFEVLYRVVEYLKKNGLFEKYKTTILQHFVLNMEMFMNIPTCCNMCVEAGYNFLKKINFPQDFESCNKINRIDDKEYPVQISVAVPIYNVEPYIRQCLDSIVNQTYKNFEVFCVDDCGKDNSMKIVEEYAKKDSRIKIIKHEKNRGLSAARNTAVEHAQGKYFICIDSDDWVETTYFEEVINAFNTTKAESVWINTYTVNEIDNTKTKLYENHCVLRGSGYYNITPENIFYCADYAWDKVYKTEFIKKYSLDWPEGLKFEDAEFYFKFFSLERNIFFLNKPLYNYRVREGSIVREANKGNVNIQDFYKILKNCVNHAKKYDIFEEYKTVLLAIIAVRINKIVNLPDKFQEAMVETSKFFNEIDFPNAYKDVQHIYLD